MPFALTYKVKNPRGEPMNHYKYTLKKPPRNPSTYQVDYCKIKSDCHLGMDNKPLIPYDAAHRLLPICNAANTERRSAHMVKSYHRAEPPAGMIRSPGSKADKKEYPGTLRYLPC